MIIQKNKKEAFQSAAILDCGTAFTKIGYGGNETPLSIIPTPNSSIRHGIVEDWEGMEKFWEKCIFQYLRCEPENHPFVLTEPPMNPPENRELTAEIMFESFDVPSLYIGVQAVFALAASFSWNSSSSEQSNKPDRNESKISMTGTVIDSGDGVTHVIPVIDGVVFPGSVKHVPMAGKEITLFIQQCLRDREQKQGVFSAEESLRVSQQIKESLCYTASFGTIQQEWNEFEDKISTFSLDSGRSIEVGFEKFASSEIFFDPQLAGLDYDPLPQIVDQAIQSCPIDCRKNLYKNICLSGGSTLFRNFSNRLEEELGVLVKERYEEKSPQISLSTNFEKQKYAVWYGASMLSTIPQFSQLFCTGKEEYLEFGSGIFRASKAVNCCF